MFGVKVGDSDDFALDTGDFDGFEKVFAGAAATAPDADDDGINGRLGIGMEDRGEIDGCSRRGCNQGRAFDELTAAHRRGRIG